MPIIWGELTRTVWVAGLQQFRAVVIKMSDVWVARVEDGDVVYPAPITFHALEGAKTWAEMKLQELVSRS